MLRTALTEALGIEHPVVQAGMGSECGARLAAAVSQAGALGTIGTIGGPPDGLATEIDACRAATSRPFAVNLVTFDWAPFARDLLEVALTCGAPVVTLSFGDPLPALERCRAAGPDVKVLVQVQDVRGARAALAARPDALIVQGNEAGGHTGRRGTLGFAAQALDIARDAGVPVVVAGGVATGRGLAAALAMGAAGVAVGTRFKATHEFGVAAGATTSSPVVDAMKEAIVASDGGDTVHDSIVDDACNLEWPHGVAGRVLANRFTSEWLGRRDELRRTVAAAVSAARHPFAFVAALDQAADTALNWAGESAGLVREVSPAAEIVASLVREAEDLLRRIPTVLR